MNYKSKNSLHLLHEATLTAVSTYTYTPANPLTFSEYAEIIVILEGSYSTVLALQGVLSGQAGTSNSSRGLYASGSSVASVASVSQAQLQLGSTTLFSNTASNEFAGKWHILGGKVGGAQTVTQGFSQFTTMSTNGFESMTHQTSSISTVSSINVKTSTGTITARLSIYGVKKA